MSKQKNTIAPGRGQKARGVRIAIGLGVMAAVAGCASLGGNVKGNFVCAAPGGICAPTSTIDDQALATMGVQDAGGARTASATATAAPTVHSVRALKVVLPARLDRFGRWREPQVVYIEPDTSVALMPDPSASTQERLSLSDLAAGAPDMAAFEGARSTVSTGDAKARVDAVLASASRPAGPSNGAKPALPAAEAVSPAPVPSKPVEAPKFPASQVDGGL